MYTVQYTGWMVRAAMKTCMDHAQSISWHTCEPSFGGLPPCNCSVAESCLLHFLNWNRTARCILGFSNQRILQGPDRWALETILKISNTIGEILDWKLTSRCSCTRILHHNLVLKYFQHELWAFKSWIFLRSRIVFFNYRAQMGLKIL